MDTSTSTATWTTARSDQRARRMQTEPDATGRLIRAELHYAKGGMNYFSGRDEARGYRLSIAPVTVDARGFESHVICADPERSGMRLFVAPAARYSDKALDALAAKLTAIVPEVLDVAQREGIRVATAHAADRLKEVA